MFIQQQHSLVNAEKKANREAWVAKLERDAASSRSRARFAHHMLLNQAVLYHRELAMSGKPSRTFTSYFVHALHNDFDSLLADDNTHDRVKYVRLATWQLGLFHTIAPPERFVADDEF